MADVNTVTLSGKLRGDVESQDSEKLEVSRFFLAVADSSDGGQEGLFKVVAFGKTAEFARNRLHDGDKATVTGKPLSHGGSRGLKAVEIQAKVITPPKQARAKQTSEHQEQDELPIVEVWDGPFEEFVEQVLPVLPFVIIPTTEGTRVLLGKQPFQAALHRATQRGVKAVAAIGAGALMALMGLGVFSLPAAFLTSLGIDRYRLHAQLAKRLETDRNHLLSYC